MPAVRVLVDGSPVATLSPMAFGVMSVSVSGTKTDEPFAHLHVSGSSHPENALSKYLVWVSDQPLTPGQVVSVEFLPEGTDSHAGKTIDELFPEADSSPQHPEPPFAEVIEELRAKPRLHERFAFELETSEGTKYTGESPQTAHGFGFNVLWNWMRPERISVALHTYTLEDLEERRHLNDLIREYVPVGGSARLKLVL